MGLRAEHAANLGQETDGGGVLGGTFGISTEFILFARRGSLKAKTRVKGTWFPWKREYVNGAPAHSRKPAAFMEMVESVSPGPRLEMFARRRREGWSAWGNEVVSDVVIRTAQTGLLHGS